jgi:catechol 2,3-dioxygenase-like lactoylglutathione lyase family enzyme
MVHHWLMTRNTVLSQCNPVAFVTVVDVERARAFYRDTLGIPLVGEQLPFALVFNANGVMLRLAIAGRHSPSPGTVFGWRVPNAASAARALIRAGVHFERYESMQQDELGIWTSPSGAKVAWFKDPDGNVLSISEHE